MFADFESNSQSFLIGIHDRVAAAHERLVHDASDAERWRRAHAVCDSSLRREPRDGAVLVADDGGDVPAAEPSPCKRTTLARAAALRDIELDAHGTPVSRAPASRREGRAQGDFDLSVTTKKQVVLL